METQFEDKLRVRTQEIEGSFQKKLEDLRGSLGRQERQNTEARGTRGAGTCCSFFKWLLFIVGLVFLAIHGDAVEESEPYKALVDALKSTGI